MAVRTDLLRDPVFAVRLSYRRTRGGAAHDSAEPGDPRRSMRAAPDAHLRRLDMGRFARLHARHWCRSTEAAGLCARLGASPIPAANQLPFHLPRRARCSLPRRPWGYRGRRCWGPDRRRHEGRRRFPLVPRFAVTTRPDGDFWYVDVAALQRATQALRLQDVDEMAHYIAEVTGLPADHIKVSVRATH